MARKNTPLSDEELLGAIDAAESAAIGASAGSIATARADAIDRYLGKAYSGELAAPEGRSSVVSRDVADVVDGVLANVIKPFVASEDTVRFDPLGPDDEERAEQESDYVNWVFNSRNNGFLVLNAAVKDALLLRSGYVKCGWTKRDDVVIEDYHGQTDEEVALLMQDGDVEVVQHTEYPMQGVMLPDGSPMLLHDLKVRRAKATEFVCIDPVPPEEVLISQRARSPALQDVDFVQHRVHKTLSELRQLGYKVDDDITDDDNAETLEDYARQRESAQFWSDETQDAARRIVLFKETWLRIDRDGDGIAELRRVCQVGKTLLADEEADIVPIAAFCPILMPHQHQGVSVYDAIEDLARLKTALMRQFMDNKYLSNNTQLVVDVDRANVDDFLTTRPGGIKRVRGAPGEAVMPLVTPDTGSSALQGLEYLDSVRENRTGYTRQTQGLETDALVSKTVGGMAMQLNQSQMRLEMIARTLAETGVREMFRIIHALTLKYSSRAEKVRLRGKWVDINPREWVRRSDLSISVGLGNASQQTLMGGLMMIGQAQQQAMPMGLVKPDNMYALLKKLVNAVGFKNAEEFFTPPEIDPQTGQPKPPPPPPNPMVQVEQMKMQAAMQMKQMDQKNDQMKFQAEDVLKQREAQASLELQRSNDERQSQLDQQKALLESQAREQEMALKRYEIELTTASKEKIELAKLEGQFALEQMRQQHDTGNREQDAMRERERAEAPEMAQISSLFLPRTVLRDAAGKVVGVDHGGVVHEVIRDAQGRVAGMRPKQQGTIQ
jgi:hypothetical protein